MSDEDLVERARQGDTGAFGQLVERHQASVFRAALAVLGSRVEAEDAAQDALVAAFTKLQHFRGDSSFKTWLLAIAWRHALDRRGRLARRIRTFFSSDDQAWREPEHPDPSHEHVMVRQDLRDRVRNVVKTLPSKYRDALLLSASGEHTFDEIGRILGVPTGTAKWRVVEARKQVKRKLAALGWGDE